jgi:adenylate cyclase class 2
MLEAEIKLSLDAPRAARLRERLAELGAAAPHLHHQVDTYFAHPARDFAQSDETLRLRLDDGRLRVTYKGPKLDPPRKTREEIEFALDTHLDAATRLLERLGFSPVAKVEKRRSDFELGGDEGAAVSIDDVVGLGVYCEIEVQTESASVGRTRLEALAARLGVSDLPPEPRSYLELLLERARR